MTDNLLNRPGVESNDLSPQHDAGQVSRIGQLARLGDVLDGDFEETAQTYSEWRHVFFERVCSGTDVDSAFIVENPDALTELHERENGAIVVLSHAGCWFAAPFAVHQIGIPFTFLMEMADDRLRERYADIGVEPIEPVPGVTFVLTDGRRIRIPGSSSLQQVETALRNGLTVGLLGDTYRPGGQQEDILGQRVELINHYALIAERLGKSILVLRQWTKGEKIHIHFEPLTPDAGLTKRSERVRSLVHNFARLLDEDLRKRPEQYAYFPTSIFGHGMAEK